MRQPAELVGRRAPGDAATNGMLWGHARPANVICQDDGFRLAALVDVDVAAWGAAELDVTWVAEMHRMRTGGSNLAPLPRLLDG